MPWSTLRNSASQEQISSVRFSLFSSSSCGGGSSLWYVHHCITFFKIPALTLGKGTGSSSSSSTPRSIMDYNWLVFTGQYHFRRCYRKPCLIDLMTYKLERGVNQGEILKFIVSFNYCHKSIKTRCHTMWVVNEWKRLLIIETEFPSMNSWLLYFYHCKVKQLNFLLV